MTNEPTESTGDAPRVPFPRFYVSRYYPVNMAECVIFNDPQKTERACSVEPPYQGQHTIGIQGRHLNQYVVYRSFTVKPPLARTGTDHNG